MPSKFRFHKMDSHRVLVSRYIGASTHSERVGAYMAFLEQHPPTIDYCQISDIRSMQGMTTEDDLVDFVDWLVRFRIQHNLPAKTKPKFVILAAENTGSEYVAEVFGDLNAQTTMTAHSATDAWHQLRPDVDLPDEVAAFLAAR